MVQTSTSIKNGNYKYFNQQGLDLIICLVQNYAILILVLLSCSTFFLFHGTSNNLKQIFLKLWWEKKNTTKKESLVQFLKNAVTRKQSRCQLHILRSVHRNYCGFKQTAGEQSPSAAQIFGPITTGSNPFGYYVLVGCFLIIFHYHLIISQ